MFQIWAEGTKVHFRIDAAAPLAGTTFTTSFECGQEWVAKLLASNLNEALFGALGAIREDAYKAGWKQAKAKKHPKETHFPRSWAWRWTRP